MPQDCERTWTYHLQSAWRHGFSLNSQPLIKSILSLESGCFLNHNAIRRSLAYGLCFITTVFPDPTDRWIPKEALADRSRKPI